MLDLGPQRLTVQLEVQSTAGCSHGTDHLHERFGSLARLTRESMRSGCSASDSIAAL